MTELGPPFISGPLRLALVHPTPYRAAMASLGYQQILRLCREDGLAAERVFLPEDGPPRSLDSGAHLGEFPVLGISLAWEPELADLIRMLDAAGIPALRQERSPEHPRILLGGPVTSSNPEPLAPFVDAMLLGEADNTAAAALRGALDLEHERWLDLVQSLDGGFVPERTEQPPPQAQAPADLLPARALLVSPEAALGDVFLVEGERGCHRRCAFCVMRRGDGPGMRVVPAQRVLDAIPAWAPRAGLVGAGISDHPELIELLEALLAREQGVGISSLRADRLARQPRLAHLLRQTGLRTLTVAADAASERLRQAIHKDIRAEHLQAAADLARAEGFSALKLYSIIGLPGEEDEDMAELADLALDLARRAGRVRLSLSPFVAKRHTPLDNQPFAGTKTIDRRVKRLRRLLKGRVELKPVSSRWAWVEHQLSQGDRATGLAALAAVRAGGRFGDWRRALG